MKAVATRLLELLKKSSQFVIPIYQRTYSWTEKECRQLWDDILRTGGDNQLSLHFMGSIVYIEQGLSQVTLQSPMLIIDGQQRLTTVSLLLAMLAEALGDTEPVDGFSARKLRNYYLLNPEEVGERHFKLLLSNTDRDTLKSVVGGAPLPQKTSLRIQENGQLFKQLLSSSGENLVTVCNGIARLVVVDIALSREHDNPQLIFESMNSTGRELSQADLIRNYVLMALEPITQTKLYEQYWHPMELEFGQAAYGSQFDSFVRHFLTLRTREIPNVNDVYEAFKRYSRADAVAAKGIEQLLSELRRHAKYFCAMALGAESDPDLRRAFRDLRELRVDVAFPLLLELYDDYEGGNLSKQDFLAIVDTTESYVFRRAVCNIPANSMNKTFATFARAINKQRYLESVRGVFLSLPSYRRFPSDDEFKRDLQTRDMYNFRNRAYWLRRLENHKRKEPAAVEEYTIEHIMPQNPNLSPSWKAALGPDWHRVHQTLLHTIGNLTLTGYNSEYGDRSFIEKRDMAGGFKESPLKLNVGMGDLSAWNESTIMHRAKRLAETAITVWRMPHLPKEILESYTRSQTARVTYEISDHPHLLSPEMRGLFDEFRTQVLALDACVSEEYLKFYVAYKAETNFVDVYPQSKRLRLILNMPFSEVNDARGISKDMTGYRLNGEVQVMLSASADIPYVLGLVRQAFDRQMDQAPAETLNVDY